jgi:hypothetical protein
MKIINENCERELAKDRTLPYTAYLVAYEVDTVIAYDIVITDKQIEIFDYYWDKYREGLKGWRQSEGRVNPRNWGYKSTEEKKKRKS